MQAAAATTYAARVRTDRLHLACFALCAAATVLPLWLVDHLPCTDLPQHAAQIALWQRLDAGHGADTYRLNWFTPYLFGYSLVRLVAFVAPIETALRAILTLYAIALPLALRAWLRALGRPVELSLLGFAAVYGFSFQWGFFNYMCALPPALLFLALGERHLAAPSRRSAAALAAFSLFLFFAHVLILAACGAILAFRAASLLGSWRGALRLVPGATGALLVPPWLLRVRANEPSTTAVATDWSWGPERFADLPALMFGVAEDQPARVLGAIVLAWGALSARAAWRGGDRRRLVAPAAALLLYLAIPFGAMDTVFLFPRFAVIFTLALVTLLGFPAAGRARRAALALLVAGILGWSGVQLRRFVGFDAEAAGFDEVIAAAEPGRSLVGLVHLQESEHFANWPYLHYPARYQARQGGTIGFSFAIFFPELVRFRPGMQPEMTHGLEYAPDRFDWERDGWFDYFLVRSETAPRFEPARGRPRPGLVIRRGTWWLYENRRGFR